jgi:hypothetical protein
MHLHTSHWHFAVAQGLPPATDSRTDIQTLAQRVDVWAHRTVCGIRGHDELLHFERGRVCLQCATCGHESPGWVTEREEAQPRQVQQNRSDGRRTRVTRVS